MLVTLLIPLTAILLGHFLLGEARKAGGAFVIGGARLIVDGRALICSGRRRRNELAGRDRACCLRSGHLQHQMIVVLATVLVRDAHPDTVGAGFEVRRQARDPQMRA